MKDLEFIHWLQGYFEISKTKSLGPEETFIIKEKLQLVFQKVTGGGDAEYCSPLQGDTSLVLDAFKRKIC